MTQYHPISCSFYDQLEALSVKGLAVDIVYVDESGTEKQTSGRIVNLFSSNKIEYAEMDSNEQIRLDKLRTVNGMFPGDYC
jgi:Rho-binding antiterminator